MLNILEEEIQGLEKKYAKKEKEYGNAINSFKEWAKNAREIDIAMDDHRQEIIREMRNDLLKLSEEIDRMKWLFLKMSNAE